MTTVKSKLTGMLVLAAGAVLCLPQVAQASTTLRGPPRPAAHLASTHVAPHWRTTTTLKFRPMTTVVHHPTTTIVERHPTTTTVVDPTTTTVVHHPTTTTTVPVVLIPPVVITPAPVVLIPPLVITPRHQVLPIVRPVADPPPAAFVPVATVQAAGQTLPLTGSAHLGVIALGGVCLIGLGLLMLSAARRRSVVR